MTEIDEFKAKLRGEVESARERIREMQDQAAEQYREMQFHYAIFLDLSRRIQEAIRPGLEAGVAVDSLILLYDLEIVPVFIEFERHDHVALPLDPSSVEKAVEWFKR